MQFFKLKSDFFFSFFSCDKSHFSSNFLISGVRLHNLSKLGLYLVMATVIVTACTDSRSDVQISRSENNGSGARAPLPLRGARPADAKFLKVVVLANIFLRKTVRMKVSSENVEKLC